MSDLKTLGAKLKPFAPLIASALGGPLAGAAASVLAKKLGAPDSTVETLESFIGKLSPDELTDLDRQYAHEKAMAEIKSDTDIALAQIDLNKQDSKHSSLFVSGWRPFIGWTCGIGIAYHFVLRPIVNGVIAYKTGGELADMFPPIDIASLSALLVGMLGLSGKRSWEKIKGVARSRIKE